MVHPMTSLPTKKSWRFLTNAWYLTPLGICCDNSHTHTPLEGSQWTRWSQVYPRELCRKYARLIREGRRALRTHRDSISAVVHTPEFKVVHSGRCTGEYPSTPFAYPVGAFKDAIMQQLAGNAKKILAPMPAVDEEFEIPEAATEEPLDDPGLCRHHRRLREFKSRCCARKGSSAQSAFRSTTNSPTFLRTRIARSATLAKFNGSSAESTRRGTKQWTTRPSRKKSPIQLQPTTRFSTMRSGRGMARRLP